MELWGRTVSTHDNQNSVLRTVHHVFGLKTNASEISLIPGLNVLPPFSASHIVPEEPEGRAADKSECQWHSRSVFTALAVKCQTGDSGSGGGGGECAGVSQPHRSRLGDEKRWDVAELIPELTSPTADDKTSF